MDIEKKNMLALDSSNQVENNSYVNEGIVCTMLQKDPKKHCNHCIIDSHIEDNCWKLHLEMNSNNHKMDTKKKNMSAFDSRN